MFIVINRDRADKRITGRIKNELERIGIKHGVRVHSEFQGKETTAEDYALLQKLLIEGKIIIDNYAKLLFSIDSFGLKPYSIYEYNAYKSKKRTLFSKLLHGKRVKYKRKGEIVKVKYKGIANKKDIIILGRNVLMVSLSFEKEVKQIFENFDVDYVFKEIVFK